MDMNAFCLGQRIPELEQRDIGILRDQLLDEGPMRRQLAMPSEAPLAHRFGMAPGPDCEAPIALRSPVRASAATPLHDRSTLPQYSAETEPEAPMAMVLP